MSDSAKTPEHPGTKHPSASSCEALANCVASHAYPQHESHNKKNAHGNENHEELAALINKRPSRASEKTKNILAKLNLPYAVLEGVTERRAEVAYAIDVEKHTVREIGVEVNRDYGPLGKYEIPTTLDVEGMLDGQPWLRDWKFGIYSTAWQLRVQAMALAWKHKVAEVSAGVVFVDTFHMDVREEAETHMLFDLDEHADHLKRQIDRLPLFAEDYAAKRPLKTIEGPWCQYCGAVPYCESRFSLVRALVPDLENMHARVDALTREQCGQAYSKLKLVKALVEKMDEALDLRLEAEGEFPLPGGKRVYLLDVNGHDYFDTKGTKALLAKHNIPDVEIKAVLRKTKDTTRKQEGKR